MDKNFKSRGCFCTYTTYQHPRILHMEYKLPTNLLEFGMVEIGKNYMRKICKEKSKSYKNVFYIWLAHKMIMWLVHVLVIPDLGLHDEDSNSYTSNMEINLINSARSIYLTHPSSCHLTKNIFITLYARTKIFFPLFFITILSYCPSIGG